MNRRETAGCGARTVTKGERKKTTREDASGRRGEDGRADRERRVRRGSWWGEKKRDEREVDPSVEIGTGG